MNNNSKSKIILVLMLTTLPVAVFFGLFEINTVLFIGVILTITIAILLTASSMEEITPKCIVDKEVQ